MTAWHSLWHSACRVAQRFSQNRKGNVAILVSLSLIPMLGAVGLAIDFGNIMVARTRTQTAADAAVVFATGVARDLIRKSDGGPEATKAALSEAKRRAQALFKAHLEQSGIAQWTGEIDVMKQGADISAQIEFAVTNDNMIAGLFGQSDFTARGGAGSLASLPTFSDIYMLLDESASMGIAANNAAMIKLFNAKVSLRNGKTESVSCVFGCHVIEGSARSKSNADVAAENKIELRIDTLRRAVKDMLSNAQAHAFGDPIFRFGIYTVGALDNRTDATVESALSGDYTVLQKKADQIQLTKYNNKGSSFMDEGLRYLYEKPLSLAKVTDGTSQAEAKNYVFMITDGARTVPIPPITKQLSTPICQQSDKCYGVTTGEYCEKIKNRGVKIIVLYTTYIPIYLDPNDPKKTEKNPYTQRVTPYQRDYQYHVDEPGYPPKFRSALEKCASPGWFFEASDETAINSAFDKIFTQITQEPMLSN